MSDDSNLRVLTNVRRGNVAVRGNCIVDRRHVIYANLCALTGELLISATLDYIREQSEEHGYKILLSDGTLGEIIDCVQEAATAPPLSQWEKDHVKALAAMNGSVSP